MKLAGFVISAFVIGFSGQAFAQGASGQQTPANPPVYPAVVNTSSDDTRGWMASGWLGASFGGGRDSSVNLLGLEDIDNSGGSSFNWGGQVGYVARGVIGGEFLADFSPSFGGFDNVLFESSPNVNSYMFNLIAVAPFGSAKLYDPYISGGIGAVTLSSNIFTIVPTLAPNINAIATESVSGTRFGWDLGGGMMVWNTSGWGFRGDVRYFRTTSSSDVFDLNNIGDGTDFLRVELSGISFWKANAGVAYRW